MIKRAFPWIAVVALAAVLVAFAYWLLFTNFMVYDDEGYVLLSLKNFSEHGGLYDIVYSQYGPFIYLFYDGLHRLLGFDFTSTSGRLITLFNWMGTAAACAAIVARLTRSALWTAFTLAGVYTYLWVMIHEPVHPGGLLVLLVTAGVWLGAEAWISGRISRFAAIAALVGTALALTKINVGVFFFGSAFAWLAVNSSSPRAARILTWLVAAGCAALPFALMHTLWDKPWVRIYAMVFSGGAISSLFAARTVASPVVGRNAWLSFFGTGIAAALVVSLLTIARGTSLHGLVDGVILEPLKHPSVYFFGMNWTWSDGSAVLAVAGAGAAAILSLRGGLQDPRVRTVVALARVAAGICFIASPLHLISTSLAGWGMRYGVGLAWICVLPLRENDRSAKVRAWLALVLVFQFLHAYPVAGSQINWATFLWVPLLALAWHDAAPTLATALGTRARALRVGAALALAATLDVAMISRSQPGVDSKTDWAAIFCVSLLVLSLASSAPLTWTWIWRPLRRLTLGAAVIAGITSTMAYELGRIGWGYYFSLEKPLGLPGAENLRPPAETMYDLRVLNENLLEHADMLFSFPGIYSTNLWTGIPTPTLTNATHWFSLLPEDRQQEIVKRMEETPRAVLVVQRDTLGYLEKTGFKTTGLLHDWLMSNFEFVFKMDGYELWVRRDRKIAELSTVRYAQKDTQATFTLTFRAALQPIEALDIRSIYREQKTLIHLDLSSASFRTERIDSQGGVVPDRDGASSRADPADILRVTVSLETMPLNLSSTSPVLFVPIGASGKDLGALRLVE